MTVAAYPAYKDSGVEWLGQMPEHWGLLNPRRAFEQRRDPALPDDEQLSATQKYGVLPQREFMAREDQKVTLALSGLDNFRHVNSDDFVISLRSFQGGIEHSRYSGCVSPAYTVLRSKLPAEPGYWARLFKSVGYITALQSVTDGIRDGKNISYEQFTLLPLPDVPLDEQAAIAAFLYRETAKIDALVDEQRRLIELLTEKRRAVISHAVTKGLDPDAPMKPSGIDWLGDVPEHWEVMPLKRDLEFVTSGSRGWASHYSDEGELFIRIGNLTRGSIDLDMSDVQRVTVPDGSEGERTRVQPGDLLFSVTAYLGSIAVVPDDLEPAYVSQHVALARPMSRRLRSQWIGLYALSDAGQTWFDREAYGGTKIQLSLDDIKDLPVLVPPLAEQDSIVEFIDASGSQFAALVRDSREAIRLLQERRTALISAAVTGKIDVRGAVPAAAPEAEEEVAV